MPARAKADEKDATRPVTEKSKGPSSFRQRQPVAVLIPAGTAASGQMTDSSSAVRVIELKGAVPAQAGTGVPGSRRQTANLSGDSVNVRGATSLQYEQRRQDQRDRRQELDQDVQRRPGGVLERIADRVADDRGLVRLRALADHLAVHPEQPRLDEFLGVVPGAAAAVHD